VCQLVFINHLYTNRPMLMGVNSTKVAAFVAVSPSLMCPPTRTHDDDALLDVFRTASEYVKLSVMDYSPFYLYSPIPTLWPVLDNEIRLAALRGVRISFICALWNHTGKFVLFFFLSLVHFVKLTFTRSSVHYSLFAIIGRVAKRGGASAVGATGPRSLDTVYSSRSFQICHFRGAGK
jgi:hypothetical protein